MSAEISLDNIDSDGGDELNAPPSEPFILPPESISESEKLPKAEIEPDANRNVKTIPLPDYSIPHDHFRILAEAQTTYANRVKIEHLAGQHPEVRALLAERDQLAELIKSKKSKK